MRKLLLSLLAMAAFTFANAQACVADTSFISAGAGVYPLPDTTMGQDPTLGINKGAYENCLFDFTFTAVVPDSLAIPGVGTVPLTSIELKSVEFRNSAGTVITTGAEAYNCEPANCLWTGGTVGCVKIEGMITAPAGQYFAFIGTEVITPAIPIPIALEFPNPTLAPGEYILNVFPQPAGGCTANVGQVESNFSAAKASPNPFNGTTTISFDSNENLVAEFKVYNLLGKLMHAEEVEVLNGDNKIEFNGSDLSAGVYIYSIGQGSDVVTERLVVNN